MERLGQSIVVVPSRPFVTASVAGDCEVCDNARFVRESDLQASSNRFRPCPTCAVLHERADLFNAVCLPARFANASFANLDLHRLPDERHRRMLLAAIERCQGFAQAPGHDWLMLCGPTGTAKTHLLAATARSLTLEKTSAVAYLAMNDVFTQLKGAGPSEADVFKRLYLLVSTVPVLLLDEVGCGRTEWEISTTSRLIQRRYDVDLPLIIATNYQPHGGSPELALSSRLYDTANSRLLGAEVLPVLGPDQRGRGVGP